MTARVGNLTPAQAAVKGRTPGEAYFEAMRGAAEAAAEITAISSPEYAVSPDQATWADVATAQYLQAQLTEIADRLCKRGEYADTPTVASFHAGS